MIVDSLLPLFGAIISGLIFFNLITDEKKIVKLYAPIPGSLFVIIITWIILALNHPKEVLYSHIYRIHHIETDNNITKQLIFVGKDCKPIDINEHFKGNISKDYVVEYTKWNNVYLNIKFDDNKPTLRLIQVIK